MEIRANFRVDSLVFGFTWKSMHENPASPDSFVDSLAHSRPYTFLLLEGFGRGEAPTQFSEEVGKHKVGFVPHEFRVLVFHRV